MIHIYTGDGKGKTTAAVGLAIRTLGAGRRVVLIQFLKGDPLSGEIRILRNLSRISVFHYRAARWVKKGEVSEEDRQGVRKGWRKARAIIRDGAADLLILDEIIVALDLGLLTEDQVLAELKACPPLLEIVLTGRNASSALIELADYVTVMKEVKHPYHSGVPARPGIEF